MRRRTIVAETSASSIEKPIMTGRLSAFRKMKRKIQIPPTETITASIGMDIVDKGILWELDRRLNEAKHAKASPSSPEHAMVQSGWPVRARINAGANAVARQMFETI